MENLVISWVVILLVNAFLTFLHYKRKNYKWAIFSGFIAGVALAMVYVLYESLAN